METSGNEAPTPIPVRRQWLTPEGAVEYLRERYNLEYSIKSIYRKSSRGELPRKRPPGGNALRFDPDELDAWAAGEWSPESVEPAEAV